MGCTALVAFVRAANSHGEPVPAPEEQRPAAPPQQRAVTDDLLTFYRDNYFISGFTRATEVKGQFSAKFDLWPNRSQHAVHFGFTEKVLWNMFRVSSPFVESNYDPELFYTFFHHQQRMAVEPGCGFFHERAGFEHESNGEAGARSRSWNRIFIESRFACYAAVGLYATAAVKVWVPFGLADNPDIVRHLGYGEAALNLGSEASVRGWSDADLTLVVRKGTNASLSQGSFEVDARWRPPYADVWRFTPFLYTQLVTGYGETLLTYDRSITSFRVGLGLTDTRARSQ